MDGTPAGSGTSQDGRGRDSPKLQWSFASSPLLHDGKVIVQCDVLSEQFVAILMRAMAASFGARRDRKSPTGARPRSREANGRTQIVLNGWKQIGGYDFVTGRSLWTLSGGGDIPVPAPLIVADWAYFTSAHGSHRPIRAVRLGAAQGNITPPDIADSNAAIAWCHPKLGSYMQTPIVIGPLAWSCDWQGILTCVDRTSGELRYSDGSCAGSAFTASAAGGRLYFLNEDGEVFIVAAQPGVFVVARNRMEGCASRRQLRSTARCSSAPPKS